MTHILHAKKIISYLSNSLESDMNYNFIINNHLIKSIETLNAKLTNKSLILFILSEKKEYLFLIQNDEAVYFKLKYLNKDKWDYTILKLSW